MMMLLWLIALYISHLMRIYIATRSRRTLQYRAKNWLFITEGLATLQAYFLEAERDRILWTGL